MSYTDADHKFDAEHAHGYIPERDTMNKREQAMLDEQRAKTQSVIDDLLLQADQLEQNLWMKLARENRRKAERLRNYL